MKPPRKNHLTTWPFASGEMAQRIRLHDWAATPLGPIERWPANLRTLVDLLLQSPRTMALSWGEQALLLYNDAYSHLIGPRSAVALGRSAYETFADVSAVFEPHLRAALAGQTVQLHDQYYPFIRTTELEDAWFDEIHHPVHSDDGAVVGVFSILEETTPRVLAERHSAQSQRQLNQNAAREAYLLRLSDALQPLSDPVAVMAEASRVLGKHLGASNVLYGEVSADGADLIIEHDHHVADGGRDLSGRYRMADFGPALLQALEAGHSISVSDIATAPELSAQERAAYAGLGIAAIAGVPLVKGGRFVANLNVHHATPHAWTSGELALIKETAERTWAAVEQVRAESALRESEARIRAIANLVPDLLWRSDAHGEGQWYSERWFEYTGQDLHAAPGQGWCDVVHPQDLRGTLQHWRKAEQTGLPYVREHRLRRRDGEYRWFLTRAEPLLDRHGNVTLWFGSATDIHEQHIARDALEQRVKERTRELERASDLRRQLLLRVETFQDEERRRIARELHDSLGQFVSAMLLSIANFRQRLTDAATLEQFTKLQQLLEAVDRELDRIVFTLRPTALEDGGLGDAITAYVTTWSQLCKQPVDLLLQGLENRRVPPRVEAAVFRVVQEALNNVAKHAHASTVSVSVEWLGRQLMASVEDDGVGFDAEQPVEPANSSRPSWGLLGMKERIEALGGTFAIESRSGRGTTVLLRVPLH
jgi:PAS domain S-box-containing protein